MRVKPLALRASILIVACMVAGCSTSEVPATQVACSTAIAAVSDPGPYVTHGSGGGFVAFPADGLQLGRSGPTGSGFEDYRFSKFGLIVRRDRHVTVEVASATGDALMSFGGDTSMSGLVDALSVGPCGIDMFRQKEWCQDDQGDVLTNGICGSEDAEWLVWAGGLWVNEPGCVQLRAYSGDETAHAGLQVGAAC